MVVVHEICTMLPCGLHTKDVGSVADCAQKGAGTQKLNAVKLRLALSPFLLLFLLHPASTPPASLSSIQIFPNFELAISSPHWRSGHNGAFHGGNSLHYTEEAEEEGKGGRLEMPKATMPTNIEHWPGPYLLYLLTTPKISSLL